MLNLTLIIQLCSQGFYHESFETRLVATFHRAGIVGIELVKLLFHVVQIVHYLHHLVSASHLEGAYHINTAAEEVNSRVNTCPKYSPFRLRGEP